MKTLEIIGYTLGAVWALLWVVNLVYWVWRYWLRD